MTIADETKLSDVTLSHGQALWVLSHLGLGTGGSEATFDTYIKALRRAGLPFAKEELGTGPGHNVTYHYVHVMELAVALALRAQAILPRDIIALLVEHRPILRRIYRQAYLERETALGASIKVRFGSDGWVRTGGVYLDLQLRYLDNGVLLGIEPRALGAMDAIKHFSAHHRMLYPRPPIPLSNLAEDVVRLATEAPAIRRGRP